MENMFSHIMIGGDDIAAAKKFYDASLGVLGHKPGVLDEKGRLFYFHGDDIFSVTPPIDGQPASHGNGSTIGFAVSGPEQANEWHAVGLANGGTAIEDPPGYRGDEDRKVYLAYLRDPAGNKICVMAR